MSQTQQQQHWHPNPSLMQQHPMPQGWQGTWPPGSNVAFPPGFPGPPPIPAGANVQHPQWKSGYWQYNPNVQGAPMPWAPGMGWGVPQANYNPYKRIPRPPSPSYWKTKLTDNGLGLEGMVPRAEREPRPADDSPDGDAVPQTPWIWNPPSLLESSADRATPTRDFNNRRSSQDSTRQASTPTRDYGTRRSSQDSHTPDRNTPSRDFYGHRGSQDSLRHDVLNPSGGHGMPRLSRQGSADSQAMSGSSRQGSSGSLMGSSRQGSTESYNSRSGSTGLGGTSPVHPGTGQSSHGSSSQGLPEGRPLGRPTDPNSFYQRIAQSHPQSSSSSSQYIPPYPAPEPRSQRDRSPNAATQPPQQPVFTSEPESFTSRVDLQPTFPSGIIRTPDHYRGSRRSSDGIFGQHDRSPTSHGGGTSSGSTSRGPPAPEPLSRQSSLPSATTSSSSLSVLSSFSEDMSAVLSPLMDATPRPAANSLSRSRTEPSLSRPNLSTIHESSSASQGEAFFHPLPPPPDDSDSDSDSMPPVPSLRDRRSTPHPARGNPLPPPPVERANLAASAPPPQEPAPAHYSHRVRKGFWNKRGDHLTPNSFVVYAPQDKAYPPELRDYPDENEGYRDQFDTFAPYLSERPELPASLPYHGRPPAQPYESFIVYSYHQ
ncbi:hypothetical protein BV22DRAFT_1195719 [Leucogyrophana mollusca]|uniref:Uncharacterized protein n=1 Tax=Leucogyrophana mollusca TaxID=85980 RepID=A0ACB8BGK6_9AGAM|nr:hypothetical protein BV22DRAFT_1195719 [Leucogyrophana mollusca]